jgi:acetyl-CoA synthetase
LGKGDAIGIHMPMTPEICIALLAIAKVGAVILPLFSGYGAGAIASRLADAEANPTYATGIGFCNNFAREVGQLFLCQQGF